MRAAMRVMVRAVRSSGTRWHQAMRSVIRVLMRACGIYLFFLPMNGDACHNFTPPILPACTADSAYYCAPYWHTAPADQQPTSAITTMHTENPSCNAITRRIRVERRRGLHTENPSCNAIARRTHVTFRLHIPNP